MLQFVVLPLGPPAREIRSPFLWRMKGKPVYLFGTVHVGPREGYALPEWFWTAYKSARIAYFENVKIGEVNSSGLRPAGTSLSNELPADLYQRLTRHENYSAGFERCILPLVAIAMALPSYARAGYVHESGLDPLLMKQSKALNQKILGLETPDIVELTAPVPSLDWVALLRHGVSTPGYYDRMVAQVMEASYEGSAAKFDAVRKEMAVLAPVASEGMLSRRELAWMPVIEAAAAGGDITFFSVGALHVTPSSTLIAQLEAKGHKFNRVTG